MRHSVGVHDKQAMRKLARTIAGAIGAFALLLTMDGCASIPQRAWDNGRTMSYSRPYRLMMSGDHSFQTMRQLYGTMDPFRSQYTPAPFQPFGRW